MTRYAAVREYLIARQRAEGLTSAAMAERLGMSPSNWCHVRAKRRDLAPVQVLRACVVYPDLRDLVFEEAAVS